MSVGGGNGRGRPPKDPEELLCENLQVRFTADEYAFVKRRAEAAKLSISAYVRQTVLGAAQYQPLSAGVFRN